MISSKPLTLFSTIGSAKAEGLNRSSKRNREGLKYRVFVFFIVGTFVVMGTLLSIVNLGKLTFINLYVLLGQCQ